VRSNVVRFPLPTPRAALRLNPVFDPIRATPEFQKWMAAAPAPEEKKETKVSAASAPAVNEKSLVVLPLENLSPDPENAFFTDGMHAETYSDAPASVAGVDGHLAQLGAGFQGLENVPRRDRAKIRGRAT